MAMSTAEKQHEYRERQKAAGRKEVRGLWASPEEKAQLVDLFKSLKAKRED